MDLLHLVDRLEEQVATAQKMPIGSRAIVDRRRLLDIIDQMRVAIPLEVREAQDMVAHREALRREAEEEARLIIARAEERAKELVQDHQVTRAARDRAAEIAVQAEARLEERVRQANADIEIRLAESRELAEQQMRAADDYATELLHRLHRQLQAFVRSVDAGIAQLDPEPQPVGRSRRPGAIRDTSTDLPASAYDQPQEPDWSGDDDEGVTDALLDDLRASTRGTATARPVSAEHPGIIDDYSMPSLDDDRWADDPRG